MKFDDSFPNLTIPKKAYFMPTNKTVIILNLSPKWKTAATGHAEEQLGSFCYSITFIDLLL